MIDGFLCDDCQTIVEFEDVGLIGSPDNDCSEFSDLITLCRTCRDKRLDKLSSGMTFRDDKKSDYKWIAENVLTNETNHKFPSFGEFKLLVESKLERP